MKPKRKLTTKQQRFVDEYLIDLNATQAAIRAGYSPRSAKQHADAMLAKPHIAAAVAAAQAARSERTQVDADYVLRRLVEIDQMDVLDIMSDDMTLKPLQDWPEVWRQFISGVDLVEIFEGRGVDREMVGILKKIKWPDKLKNIELLGKHVSVQAFRDQVGHGGLNGGPIQHVSMNVDEFAKIAQEMLTKI